MKAYLVSKYKTPMQAGEVAEPTVGDQDVLVDIHAAGVNMLDAKIRGGQLKLFLPYPSAGTTSPASSPASGRP
jgi:NADPH:quinone reductase-like Zn-dependent oxidoreductase